MADERPRPLASTGSGVLYVVATPLGNLEDITLRALRILKSVDLIAAEDTRHSRTLLAHFGIHTPLVSYYDQVERRKAPQLVDRLRAGASIALISDAGTPGIADPGYHLVRAAVAADVRVEPIPGPSAVIALLSAAGLPADRFAFDGFVPARAAARRRFLAALASEPRTVALYEAARRLPECLADIGAVMGDREVAVGRELTKHFEEILRGTPSALQAQLRARAQPLMGEVVLLIAPGAVPASVPAEPLDDAVQRLLATAMTPKDIARQLARERNLPRRVVYQAVLAHRRAR